MFPGGRSPLLFTPAQLVVLNEKLMFFIIKEKSLGSFLVYYIVTYNHKYNSRDEKYYTLLFLIIG